jgi:hypothetical protein
VNEHETHEHEHELRDGFYSVAHSGLMAPEACSLEAAVRTWFASADVAAVRQAAAEAYSKHQGCGRRAAERLFSAQ